MALAALLPPEKNEALVYVVVSVSLAFLLTVYLASNGIVVPDANAWLAFLGLYGSGIALVLYILGIEDYAVKSVLRHLTNRNEKTPIVRFLLECNVRLESWSFAAEDSPPLTERIRVSRCRKLWGVISASDRIKRWKEWKAVFNTRQAIGRFVRGDYTEKVDLAYLMEYAKVYVQNAVSSYPIRQRIWGLRFYVTTSLSLLLFGLVLPLGVTLPPFSVGNSPFDNTLFYWVFWIGLLITFALMSYATARRNWRLILHITYVACFYYLYTIVNADYLNNPDKYKTGTAVENLRLELALLGEMLLRSDWSVFTPRWASVGKAMTREVTENLTGIVYPALLKSWMHFVVMHSRRVTVSTSQRSLGWIVYYAHQRENELSQDLVAVVRKFLDYYRADQKLNNTLNANEIFDYMTDYCRTSYIGQKATRLWGEGFEEFQFFFNRPELEALQSVWLMCTFVEEASQHDALKALRLGSARGILDNQHVKDACTKRSMIDMDPEFDQRILNLYRNAGVTSIPTLGRF